MAIEVWVRNPHNYIKEVVESGLHLIAWDRGQLVKSKIDPVKHAGIHFGAAVPWRALCIGVQGTAEYRSGDSIDRPSAVYPTWEYGEDSSILEEIIQTPVGEDEEACRDTRLPVDERPVFGQEHRVVITNLPNMKTGPGRAALAYLRELQEEHPEVIIHLHGLYGYSDMFGGIMGSVDHDPRTDAQKGKVILPNGKRLRYEESAKFPSWTRIIGYKPAELAVPRERCIFNIKSALWAAEHFASTFKFMTSRGAAATGMVPDTTTPTAEYKAPETKSHLTKYKKLGDGDGFLCDTCSLSDKCKYFRDGSVCTLPNSEPKPLADFFKSRDASTIIDGLGSLAAANARRLERGMRLEETLGDNDPEVTKMIGQVFDQGTKLAKLLNPALAGGAKVQVNVGQAGVVASAGTPADTRSIVAGIFSELEARGVPRESITNEMVKGVLESANDPERITRVIEGTVE